MITPKTKMIFLNNPNNPLGKVNLLLTSIKTLFCSISGLKEFKKNWIYIPKVFNQQELEALAEICIRRDILCISDEVYEHLVYAPQEHLRIGALPGMWERTITIGSAGKTWSATGWKIGWSYGPADLIRAMHVVWQNSIYTAATPLQEACARAFQLGILN